MLPALFRRHVCRPFESYLDNDLWRDFDLIWNDPWGISLLKKESFSPSIDVKETNDAFIIKAEIPGIEKDDIVVEVRNGYLIISGEKKEDKEEAKDSDRYYYRESTYGSFSRYWRIPRNVEQDPSKIEATFKNGVLTIELKKIQSEEDKNSTRKIEIKT